MKYLTKYVIFLVIAGFVFASAGTGWARSKRVSQIPNGSVNSCANCHNSAGGGGGLTVFGQQVGNAFLDGSGDVIWGPLLASLDADGDDVSNGLELQDRFGMWQIGTAAPGNSAYVSKPYEATNTPKSTLKVRLSGMNPHVGQKLELRVFDKATGDEVGRSMVAALSAGEAEFEFETLLLGQSYWIDFYADLNLNGVYDAPPVDHAWRLETNNVTDRTTGNFNHNTNFTDIRWPYLLTIQFTGMTPHVGQLLEVRVVDQGTGMEIGRKRLAKIQAANFSLAIPGIQPDNNYQVDFYADLNKNGSYDAPPIDHAWRQTIVNSAGDGVISFNHNTNFTDIQWDYLFTLQPGKMNPHLGQLFELRVVDQVTGLEVGRTRLDAIAVADFAVKIPGIQKQMSYTADFYADMNGNGVYDVPPVDHAWRISFGNMNGDVIQNFIHNTNFTDIGFPITGIADNDESRLPDLFSLNQNYPNPFNPETRIHFTVPVTANVNIQVFNTLGQKIRVLVNETMNAGSYHVVWDGRNDAGQQAVSGIYFYRLEADSYSQTKRMLLMK